MRRDLLLAGPRNLFKVPLWVALVMPFVLQIGAVVGLTAYFSWRHGEKVVEEVATELRSEVTTRVHQHIRDFMEPPKLVARLNASAVLSGELSLQNSRYLERHLWYQSQLFKHLSPIAFGSQWGEIHSVDRLQDGTPVVRVKDRSTGSRYLTFSIDDQGNRLKVIRTSGGFDPRTRPWYKRAVQLGRAAWTEIYTFFSSSGLAISCSQPLRDKRGSIVGVTNATISLSQLGNFLHGIKIGRTGQAFIIERSGNLVTTSTDEQALIDVPRERSRRRLTATESADRVTRATARYLQASFGNLGRINGSSQFDFESGGQRYFAQVRPFQDNHGLDWLIVVVIPEGDFIERISENTRNTALL